MRQLVVVPVVALAVFAAGCKGGGGGDSKAACPVVTAPADITATTRPMDLLDLSHWSLTLPVDASGANSGLADTVTTQELINGYASDWFYASQGDGVTFFSPIQGATTANTIYPRSELREMLNPADASVNWTSADTAEMVAFVAVHQVPALNGKVTLGEIVGYNRDNPDINVLAKLVYEYNVSTCSATLYTSVLPSPTASGSTAVKQVLTRTLRLGESFPFSIAVANHTITFATGTATATEPIQMAWDGVGLYYRAGASLFANGSSLTDGARVSFYQLDVSHP